MCHNSYMNTIHTKISQSTTFSRSYLLCTCPSPFYSSRISTRSFHFRFFILHRLSPEHSNNSHQILAVASSFSSTWAPAKLAWTRKRKSIDLVHPSILTRLSLEISKTRYLLYLKTSKDLLALPSHRWIERSFKKYNLFVFSFLSFSLPLSEFRHLKEIEVYNEKWGIIKKSPVCLFLLFVGLLGGDGGRRG